ncbi:uncharacterized protein LOC131027510 [Cryptomeria japonica]|uniref:uncharacterized protein LOC131027510 n=1 Tax=Cryptomeria japonica TaxID=3369 RepID=UPI0025AD2288|nr:uncharacterized protein LOC131027510 [Cryptomeria japonica]
MTLEDVYQILRILITSELVEYDVEEVDETDALQEMFVNPHIVGYSVAWQDMVDNYAPLPLVLAGPGETIPTLEEVNDNDDQGRGGVRRDGRKSGRGRRGGRIVVGGVIGHGWGGGGVGEGGGDEGGGGVVRGRGGVVRGRGGRWRMDRIGQGGPV